LNQPTKQNITTHQITEHTNNFETNNVKYMFQFIYLFYIEKMELIIKMVKKEE